MLFRVQQSVFNATIFLLFVILLQENTIGQANAGKFTNCLENCEWKYLDKKLSEQYAVLCRRDFMNFFNQDDSAKVKNFYSFGNGYSTLGEIKKLDFLGYGVFVDNTTYSRGMFQGGSGDVKQNITITLERPSNGWVEAKKKNAKIECYFESQVKGQPTSPDRFTIDASIRIRKEPNGIRSIQKY